MLFNDFMPLQVLYASQALIHIAMYSSKEMLTSLHFALLHRNKFSPIEFIIYGRFTRSSTEFIQNPKLLERLPLK